MPSCLEFRCRDCAYFRHAPADIRSIGSDFRQHGVGGAVDIVPGSSPNPGADVPGRLSRWRLRPTRRRGGGQGGSGGTSAPAVLPPLASDEALAPPPDTAAALPPGTASAPPPGTPWAAQPGISPEMSTPLSAPPGTPAVPARPAQEAGRGQATLVEPPHAAAEGPPNRPAAGAASGPPAAAPADEVTTFRIGRIIRRTPLPVWILVVLYMLTLACWSFLVPVFSAVNEPAAVDGVMRIHQDQGWPSAPSKLLPQTGAAMDRTVYGNSLRPLPDNPVPPAAPLRGERPSWDELATTGASPEPGPQALTDAPPLFYGVGSAALTLIPGSDSWGWDQSVAVLRLLSLLMAAPLPLLAWAAARRLTGSAVAGVTAAVVPFAVPELSHVSSTVTSDALLILLGGLAAAGIAFVLRGDRTLGTAIRLGVITGLAALTALPGLVVAPWVLAAYAIVWYRVSRDRRVAARLATVGGPSESGPDHASANRRKPLHWIGHGIAAGARGVAEAARWLFAQPEPRQRRGAAGERYDEEDEEGIDALHESPDAQAAEEAWDESYPAGTYPADAEVGAGQAEDADPGVWAGGPYGEEPPPRGSYPADHPGDAGPAEYIDLEAPRRAEPQRFQPQDAELDYWDIEDRDAEAGRETAPFDESHAGEADHLPGEQEPVGQLPAGQPTADQPAIPAEPVAEAPPATPRRFRFGLPPWRRPAEQPGSSPDATSRRRTRPKRRPSRLSTLGLVVLVLAIGCGGFWWVQRVIRDGSLKQGILTDQGSLPGSTWEQLRSITAVIGERWWAAIGWAEVTFTKPVVIAAAVVLTAILVFAVARARGWRMRFDLLFMLVPTAVLFIGVAIRAFAVGGDIHAPGGPSGRLLFVGVAGLAAVAGAAAPGLPRRIRGWAPLTVLALAGGLQAEAVRLTLNHFWGFADDPTAALRAAAGWSAWPGAVLAALGLCTGLLVLIAVVAMVRVEEQEDALPAPPAPRLAPAPAVAVVAATATGTTTTGTPEPVQPPRAAGDAPTVALPAGTGVPLASSGAPPVPPPSGEWEPYPGQGATLAQGPTGLEGPQGTQPEEPVPAPAPDAWEVQPPTDTPRAEPTAGRPRRRLGLRKGSRGPGPGDS